MMTKKLLVAITILTSFSALAQTPAQRARITANYDHDKIESIKQDFLKQQEINKSEVEAYLAANPSIAKSFIQGDEDEVWISGIDRYGQPIIITTTNFEGGETIGSVHLYDGGSLGLNIDGSGITAGIWDGGYARQNHAEFGRRVDIGESGQEDSAHGTHVGGTMIAEGKNDIRLRGIAPNGNLITYRFDNDAFEMLEEAQNGMLVSNHSYGRGVTENTDVAIFGKYDGSSQQFDIITDANPFYLPVVSAGNDRGKGLNARKSGYDLLTDRTLSKNSLVVGAILSVEEYVDEDDVTMSTFSSWGPSDDGRIKPDVVAKGVNVLSTYSRSTTDSAILQGTSMSAPMVSGAVMLLQQLYSEQEGTFMKSATVRGLVSMTTKEAGKNEGPDYQYGWGLLDVEAAAKMILGLNETSFIEEKTLFNGQAQEQTFATRDDDELTFTISWTDRPGQLPSEERDDRTPVLVNNLDIKVVAEDGTEFFPYLLDPSSTRSSAQRGINNVDNIEVVKISKPSGNYRVIVSNQGILDGFQQDYTMMVNGATPSTASNIQQDIASLSVYPNPASNFFNVTFSSGIDGREVDINVYNSLGQQVISKTFDNNGNFNQRINTQGLSSGLYVVQIGDGNVSTTRKLVIR
ncbi:S8 family serine peptidase [Nonlabens ponticola]|uniref:T9SS type A sorting domain-containing protein n=1 Tax=Nonlabens ponticola TaxID=2496866 RepID=A0A3S9MY45_9FLAO|nr:S8 family serine peptidase [Nonlabens ponticola]AZQ44175.1 T9SS type A sorting domain-containing protein [Nonlabens ponticola]